MEALKTICQLVANYLELAQRKRDTKAPAFDRKLKEGDCILIRIIQLIYGTLYTVGIIELSFYGKAQAEVVDSTSKTKTMYIPDMKYILSTDKVISKLPYYQSFGRQCKLGTNAKYISSLK